MLEKSDFTSLLSSQEHYEFINDSEPGSLYSLGPKAFGLERTRIQHMFG